jgi:hypothetical protein
MTWNSASIAVGIKAIGKVESNMNYGAINPVDPVTVGLFQWFGTRCAKILQRMRDENPSAWTGLPASLTNNLTTYSYADSFWNTRYFTGSEVTALRPVLIANHAIQDDQAAVDLESYKSVGVNNGIDADANTNTMLFFCNMYNQSPTRALRVLASAGPNSNLDRIYAYCLNDSVLGQYRTRYTDAYNIIKNGDSSGVGDTSGSGGSTTPGGDVSTSRPTTDIVYISKVGDSLHIKYKDTHTLIAVPDGRENWIPQADNSLGSDTPGDVDGPPATGDIQADMRQWLIDHNDDYAYSQGASRLTPNTNMSTDCSGLMYWVYKTIANVYIGTWTGDQSKKGALITTNPVTAKAETSLAVGDLVFYRWSAGSPSTYDHVAMYIGSNQIESHGGPDPGPDLQSHSGAIDSAIGGGGSIMVRRYV